jgi:hypothetical protein
MALPYPYRKRIRQHGEEIGEWNETDENDPTGLVAGRCVREMVGRTGSYGPA